MFLTSTKELYWLVPTYISLQSFCIDYINVFPPKKTQQNNYSFYTSENHT